MKLCSRRGAEAVVATVVACIAGATAARGETASSMTGATPPIMIGGDLDLTGGYASLGVSSARGIVMAFQEANARGGVFGRKVGVKLEDSSSSPQQAVALMTTFAAQKDILAVIGPTGSQEAPAVAPVANSLEVPDLTATAISAAQIAGPWGFKIRPTADPSPTLIANAMIKKFRYSRVAIVNLRDNQGAVATAQIAQQLLQQAGVHVDAESILSTDTDFSAVAAKISAFKPQAVYVVSTTPIAANVQRQAREAGLPATTQFFGEYWQVDPIFLKIGGPSVEGTIFSADYSPGSTGALNQQFVKKYEHRYGELPTSDAAAGYTAGQLIIRALQHAGPNPTRAKLRASLEAIRCVPSVLGAGRWCQDGSRSSQYPFILLQLRKGVFVPYR